MLCAGLGIGRGEQDDQRTACSQECRETGQLARTVIMLISKASFVDVYDECVFMRCFVVLRY